MTESIQVIIWSYFIAINLCTWAMFGIDKQRAKKKQWRIPEKILLGLAAIGGSIGALGGMYYFRHKTQKEKFTLGIPVIFAVQMMFVWVMKQVIL